MPGSMGSVTEGGDGHSPRSWIAVVFGHRFGGVAIVVALFVALATVTRIGLAWASRDSLDGAWAVIRSFAIGFGFDLLTALLAAIPATLWCAAVPQRWLRARWHRRLAISSLAVVAFGLVFIATAEIVFWNEFDVRFNFIAVDYLIYTYEVVGNIWQSYPMPAILAAQALLTAALLVAVRRLRLVDRWLAAAPLSPGRRVVMAGLLVGVPLAVGSVVRQGQIPDSGNAFHVELAKNGIYSFAVALQSKQLEYAGFYSTMDETAAFDRARTLVGARPGDFRSDDPLDFVHHVAARGPERRLNVIQITVESLSLHFVGAYQIRVGLTPNLDRIAAEGIRFDKVFATGTRTTRGMEAIALSLPPTPGRSILHRDGSTGLFNLGTVFRQHGYETVFLYGGFSYFDHMSRFFGGNGYSIVDRTTVADDDITFANVWGACDEDLYRWTVREADRLHAAERPFYFFVMTTSNHRPYTYPDGKIDIPSHSGRLGAVKYTDHAIGELMRAASTRPWFKDTIFVFIADHTASSSGKAELEVRRYRIPWIIYAPAWVKPGAVGVQCSQIDVGPTVLGLLNWSYDAPFFGRDALRTPHAEERAFVGNYQKLGLLESRKGVVLKPVRQSRFFACNRAGEDLTPLAPDPVLEGDAVALYQAAATLFSSGRLSEAYVTGAGAPPGPPAAEGGP